MAVAVAEAISQLKPGLLVSDVYAIPRLSSLPDLAAAMAGSDQQLQAEASERLERLVGEFERVFGEKPFAVGRAPGRVNLIGEHIDYEGYAVLPMAIHLDTVVAIRAHALPPSSSSASPPLLRVANVNSAKYPLKEFVADPTQEVDTSNHTWANYFLCAYKGVFDALRDTSAAAPPLVSLDVMVDGRVPIGSGLSSSAALVCSSLIAVMAAMGLSFPKAVVADVACRCERYVGTQSGGMDQAISVFGQSGVAQLIEFDPVRAYPVPLPAGASFVIANSLATSLKAQTAATNYNRRVVECRLAAMVLAVQLNTPEQTAIATINTLSDVEALLLSSGSTPAAAPASGPAEIMVVLDNAVKSLLHEAPYTAEEIESLLGSPLTTIFASSPSSLRVVEAAPNYKLQQRARHVYSEAYRVRQFRSIALSAADSSNSAITTLTQLGSLMNDSHHSCSQLYECSSPELEELVSASLSLGALGARLTGAGWGGCAVALVEDSKAAGFVAGLREKFFESRIAIGRVKESALGDNLFASHPSAGAALWIA